MGLDMYAYTLPKAWLGDDEMVDFHPKLSAAYDKDSLAEREDLFYWRKHPDLHGWMEALYRKKGGADEFNCRPVRLTEDDLIDLEGAVKLDALPPTTGFFFGESSPEGRQRDLQFILLARSALAEGKIVYYDSWW